MNFDFSQKLSTIKELFTLKDVYIKNRTYILLIAVAYIFSLLLHSYWFVVFGGMDVFKFNGEFIITSPDGWFWGKGVIDALSGVHGIADQNREIASLSKLAAVAKMLLPFVSLETIMFYMPPIVSGLSVIPLVLIGRLYNQPLFGFLAAIFVMSLPGIYGRTGFGYFDDDMLTLQLPIWILYASMRVIRFTDSKSIFFLAISTLFYLWWYPKSFTFLSSIVGMLFVYTVLFDKRNYGLYFAIALMLFAMSNMPMFFQLLVIVASADLYNRSLDWSLKNKLIILSVFLTIFVLRGGFEPVISPFKMYFLRQVTSADDNGLELHYFTSLQTVSESMRKPFLSMLNEFALRKEFFWLGIFSFVLLLIYSRAFVMLFPILFIGLLSVDSGSRFIPYANIAFGIFLAFFATLFLMVKSKRFIQFLFISIFAGTFVYFAYVEDKKMQGSPFFSNKEVAIISEIKNHAEPGSTIFSWWDYGYPVQFYTGLKTISDGGRQGGESSFVESTALIAPSQEFSARLLREVVEHNGFENAIRDREPSLDANTLMARMYSEDFNSSKKTKEAYLMIPARMGLIFNTIAQFGIVNLSSGQPFMRTFFSYSNLVQKEQNIYSIDNNSGVVDLNIKMVKTNSGQQLPIKTLVMVDGSTTGSISKYADVGTNVVINKRKNIIAVMPDSLLDSVFVQLFLLEKPDDRYFTPVFQNPAINLYRVNI